MRPIQVYTVVMNILIKRAYDEASDNDGYRILVDRLWPRGIKKVDLKIDKWCKEVAPSGELRQWFAHDPVKFNEFSKRYKVELDKSDAVSHMMADVPPGVDLTLVYSAKDIDHNQAVVLREYLESFFK